MCVVYCIVFVMFLNWLVVLMNDIVLLFLKFRLNVVVLNCMCIVLFVVGNGVGVGYCILFLVIFVFSLSDGFLLRFG